ncbi:MAG: helix-turn-helix transcriptional regulator [Mediterranea sp.]|jgi:DNA-binding CsgD family transcriptional regulator|nr:helix-turn-helix transcriptional regulator [Mediterranea sp.]
MGTPTHTFSTLELDLIEQLCEAVSHTTYATLFIIDHHTHSFHAVKGHPLLLCGHTEEEVQEMGLRFFAEHSTPEGRLILETFHQAMHNYVYALHQTERENRKLMFSFHFQLVADEKKRLPVRCEMTPMLFNENGDYRLVYSKLSLTPRNEEAEGLLLVKDTTNNQEWKYSWENHQWNEYLPTSLSELERSILTLTSMGYTEEDIANESHKALSTIKSCKQRLFEKLEVKNVMEATGVALTRHLL